MENQEDWVHHGKDFSHLSKSERKKLRKQQRIEQVESARGERKRKKIIKRIVIVTVIILLIVLYMALRSYRLKDAPLIQITPVLHNFGSVSVAEGTVSTTMEVENQGKTNLIINKIKSTCGCTSASLTVDGIESPTFGMHDTSTSWYVILTPGQKAQLKVNYNPEIHMEMRGAVTREIMLFSNDPKHSVESVRIEVYQVD